MTNGHSSGANTNACSSESENCLPSASHKSRAHVPEFCLRSNFESRFTETNGDFSVVVVTNLLVFALNSRQQRVQNQLEQVKLFLCQIDNKGCLWRNQIQVEMLRRNKERNVKRKLTTFERLVAQSFLKFVSVASCFQDKTCLKVSCLILLPVGRTRMFGNNANRRSGW